MPSRYLYSVHRGKLNLLSNVLAACWVVAVVVDLFHRPQCRQRADRQCWRLKSIVAGSSDPAVAAVPRVLHGDVLGHQLAVEEVPMIVLKRVSKSYDGGSGYSVRDVIVGGAGRAVCWCCWAAPAAARPPRSR